MERSWLYHHRRLRYYVEAVTELSPRPFANSTLDSAAVDECAARIRRYLDEFHDELAQHHALVSQGGADGNSFAATLRGAHAFIDHACADVLSAPQGLTTESERQLAWAYHGLVCALQDVAAFFGEQALPPLVARPTGPEPAPRHEPLSLQETAIVHFYDALHRAAASANAIGFLFDAAHTTAGDVRDVLAALRALGEFLETEAARDVIAQASYKRFVCPLFPVQKLTSGAGVISSTIKRILKRPEMIANLAPVRGELEEAFVRIARCTRYLRRMFGDTPPVLYRRNLNYGLTSFLSRDDWNKERVNLPDFMPAEQRAMIYEVDDGMTGRPYLL